MLENLLTDLDLNERITNALWDAFFGRAVTAGYYRTFTEVSAGTATADLKAATAAGLLKAVTHADHHRAKTEAHAGADSADAAIPRALIGAWVRGELARGGAYPSAARLRAFRSK